MACNCLKLTILQGDKGVTLLFPQAMGLAGKSYKYTKKLLELEATSACNLSTPVSGFIPVSEWDPYLRQHPDQRLAAFLRWGFTYGFRIGFNPSQTLISSKNLQSVCLNPQVVTAYVQDEISRGRLRSASLEPHISPIGSVPKPHQPGKAQLICDLSSP